LIGKTISHYKITEKLGEGGMGEVYLAKDTDLQRNVAIKFLPEHLTRDKDNIERFRREAQAAASLNHPNIVTIHEISDVEDQTFIVMEYVEGKSLRDLINEYKLENDKIIDIISQISVGLSKAHQAGIVHRDIKPENIIIDKDARVKILDFGLAKLKGASKLTKDTSTVGTVHYMSPEQIRGEEVDNRSDIWSLGVVLYEMLSGDVPFKGEYSEAIHYAILNEEQEELDVDIDERLRIVINNCLNKNVNKRYQAIKELVNDLHGEHEKKPDAGSFKRRLIYITLSVTAVVVILLGYIFSLLSDKESSETVKSEWENSIAVIPFDNFGNEPEQEYFCEGMTEQIISNLSRLPQLKVIGRQSVMRFKDSDKLISEIGGELGVNYVLQSSVRRSGSRIRVTTQLIGVKDNFQVWADDFDRDYGAELFNLQDELCESIASNLLTALSPNERKEIKSRRTINTKAYEYFLKANHFSRRYDLFQHFEDLFIAESLYIQAIELDPNFAPSYTGISYLYSEIIFRNYDAKKKYLPLKEKYLKIAEELDPNSAEVFYDKSFLYQVKRKPDIKYKYLKKALRIDPNHYGANQQMGIFLREIGLAHLSFPYFNRAIEVNPLGQWAYVTRGWAYYYIGEFEKAEADFKSNLNIEPNDYWTLRRYTALLIMLNRKEDAEELLNHFKNEYSDDPYPIYYESLLFAMQGDSLNALHLFKKCGLNDWEKVILYSVLNRDDAAILLMIDLQQEDFTEGQRSRYLQLSHLGWYDGLRSHPRFQEILAKHKELYEENLKKYGDIDI